MMPEQAIDFLNFYRNCHYSDPSGTESHKIAEAINAILPEYVSFRNKQKTVYIDYEPFTIEVANENGVLTGEDRTISRGSCFVISDSNVRLLGGDPQEIIRLEGVSVDEGVWLEMSRKFFEEHFKPICAPSTSKLLHLHYGGRPAYE